MSTYKKELRGVTVNFENLPRTEITDQDRRQVCYELAKMSAKMLISYVEGGVINREEAEEVAKSVLDTVRATNAAFRVTGHEAVLKKFDQPKES